MDIASIPDAFQSKLRLSIITALMMNDADFTTLKKLTNATDGNLGKQMELLATAGYVSFIKESVGKKIKTIYSITCKGKNDFREYVAMLEDIVKLSYRE